MTPAHVNGLAMDAPGRIAKVKIGPLEYGLQWGPLAQFMLSAAGLTTNSVLTHLQTASPQLFSVQCGMLSAFAAHNFKPNEAPTAQEWAMRLQPGQMDAAFMVMRGLLIEANVWRDLTKNAPTPEHTPAQIDQAPTS